MSVKDEIEKPFGLQVKVSKHGSPRIAQLLKNTIFGTEGKIRYRQQEISERIQSQANIQFIEILKGKRVLGTVGMANRNVHHGDETMPSLYVRYLSVAQPFKSRKPTPRKNTGIKKDRKGSLRNLIGAEITSHFEQPFVQHDREGVFYAYVESANSNSRNLCTSMGFEPSRKVETLLFSRFNPLQKKSIHNIAEYEHDEVQDQLRKFYSDYSFYFEDKIFRAGFYLVKKEKGKIIGGIRATPVNWQLVDYPGFEGWLMRDVLPYLPLTGRLFQTNAFKFLAFDYAWHIPNHEYLIPQMMSHCCSLFDINVGMIWGDMYSDLIKNLKTGNELGFMHSVTGSIYADLMIRPINFQRQEKSDDLNTEIEFLGENGGSTKKKKTTQKVEEREETFEPSKKENSYSNTEVNTLSNTETSPNGSSIESNKGEPIETTESEHHELKKLQEILKRPVFVSALDMT